MQFVLGHTPGERLVLGPDRLAALYETRHPRPDLGIDPYPVFRQDADVLAQPIGFKGEPTSDSAILSSTERMSLCSGVPSSWASSVRARARLNASLRLIRTGGRVSVSSVSRNLQIRSPGSSCRPLPRLDGNWTATPGFIPWPARPDPQAPFPMTDSSKMSSTRPQEGPFRAGPMEPSRIFRRSSIHLL